jgi:ABC-type ATPase involved in cell division
MISFSNINKQYGKQLLFVDASFQLNPGRLTFLECTSPG